MSEFIVMGDVVIPSIGMAKAGREIRESECRGEWKWLLATGFVQKKPEPRFVPRVGVNPKPENKPEAIPKTVTTVETTVEPAADKRKKRTRTTRTRKNKS